MASALVRGLWRSRGSKQLNKKRFKLPWGSRNLTSSRLTALNRYRRAVVFLLIDNQHIIDG
ncbi:MAG: hypothetical protein OXH90_10345 [Paracoccaceae bacterium]|nr:hypothetical protein [Paracoccaceae bacterium]